MSSPFRPMSTVVDVPAVEVDGVGDDPSSPQPPAKATCGCNGGPQWHGPCMWMLVGALATLGIVYAFRSRS